MKYCYSTLGRIHSSPSNTFELSQKHRQTPKQNGTRCIKFSLSFIKESTYCLRHLVQS